VPDSAEESKESDDHTESINSNMFAARYIVLITYPTWQISSLLINYMHLRISELLDDDYLQWTATDFVELQDMAQRDTCKSDSVQL